MLKYSTKDLPRYSPFTCPRCKAKIPRYEEVTQYVGCPSCCSYYEVVNNELNFKVLFKKRVAAVLPIGSKGKFKNKKYQIVGAVLVKESNKAYYWTEYFLKAEDGTYSFLSEYEGHWSFVRLLENNLPPENKKNFSYLDEEYIYFNHYKTVNVGAAGEFDWDIFLTEKPTIKEYIAPPLGLIKEKFSKQTHWFATEYLTPSKVREIFSLPSHISLPYRSGGYSIQPFPLNINLWEVKRAGILFLLSMLAIVFLGQFINYPYEVYRSRIDIPYRHNTDSNSYTTPAFKISGLVNTTAVDVNLWANVSNDWMEASFSLINEKTGAEYFFDQGVEYYYGNDGGESWSEGSTSHTTTLSDIPDGTYRMIIKPFLSEKLEVKEYEVSVTQNVTLWSNFWLLTLIGIILPLIIGIWEYIFNSYKWYTSNLIEYE